MAGALLALPLGPFSWTDAWAATGDDAGAAAKAADEQENNWSFEYPLGGRVAMGQTLYVTAKMPVPESEGSASSEGNKVANTGSADATVAASSYVGILRYKANGSSWVNLARASAVVENGNYVIHLKSDVTPFSDSDPTGWAEVGSIGLIEVLIVDDSDGTTKGENSQGLTIEPSSRIVFLNAGVPADDVDQPTLDVKSIEATYGRSYSYDPTATTAAGATRMLPTPKRPNYDFAGWYTSYNAKTGAYGTKVDENSTFAGTLNQTLYAKWTGKRYEVLLIGDSRVDERQGYLSANRFNVTYGETYKQLAEITGTGTTGANTELRGWTDYYGNPVNPEDKVVDPSTDKRIWTYGTLALYAVWGEARTSIEDAVISGVEKTYPYTGKDVTVPALKVTLPEIKDEETGEVTRQARELTAGTDYTVEYADNREISSPATKARIIVKGAGKYKGSVETSFDIVTGTPYFEVEKKDTASAEHFDFDFNGSGSTTIASKLVTDAKEVTYALAKPVDGVSIDAKTGSLTVAHPVSNVTVVATAAKGTKFDATPAEGAFYTFSVKQAELAATDVALSSSSLTYTGKKQTPKLTVKNAAGKVLAKDVDYAVKFASGCKSVGTYKVTVTGLNGYKGTAAKSFTIVPKTSSKVTAKRYGATKSKGKSYGLYTLSWKKVAGANGYQVYRTVASKTAKSTFNAKTTSKKFGWEKGKKVTVKVRAYQKVDGKRYYSAWKAISVKAK